MGKFVDFPRRTSQYGAFDYTYTGQVQKAVPIQTAPARVIDAFSTLSSLADLKEHNAVLLNWYDASLGEYMGAHSDDERELLTGAPVISLSWCAPSAHYRRFRLTARPGVSDALLPTGDGGKMPGVLNLYDGCLVVMGGDCQATHKHELMKVRSRAPEENVGRRINLTLRAFRASGARAARAATSRKRERERAAAEEAPPAADG